MKQDLATSIFAAVVGALVAYFVCGMFLPSFDDMSVSITKLANEESFSLMEPEAEIFNYRSVNPTVEVWVGDCKNLGDNGICNDEIVTDNTNNGQNNNQDEQQEEEPEQEENQEEENKEENKEEENENQNQNENGDNQNGTTD
ncbi:hypothetical protein IJI89_03345 [Candidatus Saccharibacteria bacterium]|nr:hypothetical protein [Candidatus Saccharibacteria bacterium]